MARTARIAAGIALGAAALTAGASNATAIQIPDGLCEGHTFSTPFAPFGDSAPYTLVPGGGFEAKTVEGWATSGRTPIAKDNINELGLATDTRSLSIPSGGVVTSPLVCVTTDYPYFRFTARSKTGGASRLKVEVLYEETSPATVIPVGYLDGSKMTSWAPTPQMYTGVHLATLVANLDATASQLDGTDPLSGAGAMRIRITTVGGAWDIDNVYVDPRMR